MRSVPRQLTCLMALLTCATTLLPQRVFAAPVPADSAATGADRSTFDLMEIVVDGNTLLPTEEVERAVYASLGEKRSIKDIESARSALEARFQALGYLTVAVTIPEQKIEEGVVHLRVLEGKVGRLRITGSRYFDLGYIRERAPSLAEGSVPSFPEVQKELSDLNHNADRKVSPALRTGRLPGTVDVDLNVEDSLPVHASVELSNRSSQFSAPLRLMGAVRYDNLWQREHSFGLTWQVAPQHPSESSVITATYGLPANADTSINFYVAHSSSDVAPGAFDAVGRGTTVGSRYVLPLPGSANLFHSFTVGLDHKAFSEAQRLQGQDISNTPITYTPLLLQYAGFMQTLHTDTQFGLTANMNSGNILGNRDSDFENKRAFATASYFALRGDLAVTRKLSSGWQMYAKAAGQLSASPLISNEQFSIGGAESVRGYREAEALGDFGGTLTLEVRSPNLLALTPAPGHTESLRLLGFFDAGSVKVHSALPQQTQGFVMESLGLGLRFDTAHGQHLALDLAHSLRDGVYTRNGTTRINFRVADDF